MLNKISIVIPNYNGRRLLEKNLPILARHAVTGLCEVEIIVVDDGSTDASAAFVRESFPRIKVLEQGVNQGYILACNRGVREAGGEIVYLLNSDVEVCAGFLDPVILAFKKDVFAVTSAEVDPRGPDATGRVSIPLVKFKLGIFWYWYEELPKGSSEPVEALTVSGGHTAYDRKAFLELGGYDYLFRPLYAEDGDVCWRAWKKGLKSLIAPKSKVIHECQATMSKLLSPERLKRIHWKNRFLLTWKDLTCGWLIFKHLFFLLPGLVFSVIMGKSEFAFGFLLALRQFPEAIRSRRKCGIEREVHNDRYLFKRFSKLHSSQAVNVLYLHETSKISGAENSLLNLAGNIDKKRFAPVFALPEEGPLSLELKKMGIEVAKIGFPSIRKGKGVFRALKELARLVKGKDILLMHSNSIRTHIYASVVGRLHNVPVIWHQRNLITGEIADPDRLLSFLPQAIICNSSAVARRFAARGKLPAKVKVVINGVDTQRFNPAVDPRKIRDEFMISPEETVIGISSRFGKEKDHETFFKAAKLVLEDPQCAGLRFRFLVAGAAVFDSDKWREAALLDITKGLGITDKVKFIGFRQDMPEVYAAMDIFVLTSLAEPCGRVLFEAMAMGKPVVATDSGGTPEIVVDKETGILIPPADPRALAQALIFLARNKDSARKMGEAGRKLIERRFTIMENVRQTESVYEELLNRYGA